MTLGFETGESRLDAGVAAIDGGVPLFWVAGELDLATCGRIEDRLVELARSERSLILDLRRCTFVDSSALSLVTRLHQDLSARDGDGPGLALLVADGAVTRVLQLAGIDRIVPVFADPDSALAELNAP
jgi:stage II sporulation protein AA (anti-sigma F factor antagonist)